MKTSGYASIFITACCLLSASSVSAQEQQPGPWSFTVEGGGLHQDEADLKDSGGGFALDRWFVGAGVDYAFNFRNAIGLSLGGGRSSYEFSDADGIATDGPWDEIEDYRVSVTGRFGFGATGSLIIIPTVRYNGEKGARSGDSRTYGLFAAAAWRISEDLTIGPGFGVFSRLEDGTRAFPILVIDWNISERWNLATGRGLAASQGPGLTLTYALTENWKFGLSGRYEDVEFRLDDEGPAPGGVGRDQSFPLVLSAALEPDENVSLSVFAGVELGGRLKLKNALDEVIEESDYDPSFIAGATFSFRF